MDTSTPLGRLMLGILSAFAQLERENIRERTRMGMKERVKAGLWPGGGRIPFGYDYDKEKGVLTPNANAETVRKIYELYLSGYSAGRIARMTGLKYEKLALQILTRKSNAGYISYNGEEYLGRHEAIISLDTYERAMDFMLERASGQAEGGRYLFTGLLHCGRCGAKMRYQKWGKDGCKIVCYSRDKSKPHLVKDAACDNARQWACDLESAVLEDLFSFSLKEKRAAAAKVSAQSVLEILNRQYDEAARKMKRLYNLYSESSDDILPEAIEELRRQLAEIKKQITREEERNVISEKIEKVRKTLTTLKESWPYMTAQEQRNVIRSCVEKIVIDGERVEIFYKFAGFAQEAT